MNLMNAREKNLIVTDENNRTAIKARFNVPSNSSTQNFVSLVDYRGEISFAMCIFNDAKPGLDYEHIERHRYYFCLRDKRRVKNTRTKILPLLIRATRIIC